MMATAILETVEASKDFGQELRDRTVCVKITCSKFGELRRFRDYENDKTAKEFGARASNVRGKKVIIDTRDSDYRELKSLLQMPRNILTGMTAPYPESGKRLLDKSRVPELEELLTALQSQIETVKERVRERESVLIAQAQEAMGDLFEPSAYADGIAEQFSFSWAYTTEEPPEYLKQFSPELYERENKRMKALFDEAASLAVQELTSQLHKCVSAMVDRLTVKQGEKQKAFHVTLVDNLTNFFEQFQKLNIGNSKELEAVVEEAKGIVTSDGDYVTAGKLRGDSDLRAHIAEAMSSLQDKIDAMIIEKPKRRIKL